MKKIFLLIFLISPTIIFPIYNTKIKSIESEIISLHKELWKDYKSYYDKMFKYLDQLDPQTILGLLDRNNLPFDGETSEVIYPQLYDKVVQYIFSNPYLLSELEWKYQHSISYPLEYIYFESLWKLLSVEQNTEKHYRDLYEIGLKARKKDLQKYYTYKRILVYYYLFMDQENYYLTDAGKLYLPVLEIPNQKFFQNENLWRYGSWALYDNDKTTTSIINTNTFKIRLYKNFDIKFFNGNGRSKSLYYKNTRIKSLIGKLPGKEPIIIQIPDTFNWKDLRLPNSIDTDSWIFTVHELYSGTKYEDICVSEIVGADHVFETKYEDYKNSKASIYHTYLKKLAR